MRTRLLLVAALAGIALLAAAAGSPPAVQVSGPSPFSRCAEDEPARQPGSFAPSTEVEPRLAVNPRNPRNLVGTYQQDRWDNGGARGLVAAASFDGGLTWTTAPIPGLSRCSGGTYDRATDPWLSFAPNGDVYHVALAFDGQVTRRSQLREPGIGRERRPPEAGGGYQANALLVSKSQTGGLTWSAPAVVNLDPGDGFNDKEMIVADPGDPSRAYLVWDYYYGRGPQATMEILFSRTVDGGRTWEHPRAVYAPDLDHTAAFPQLVAQPDGTLLVFFTYWMPSQRDAQGKVTAWRSLVAFKRSRDGGRTWQPTGEPQGGVGLGLGSLIVRGTYLRTGSEILDVVGDPRTGYLYVVWKDAYLGPAHTAAFTMSQDGGTTWSAPIRVSQNPRIENREGNESWHSFTPTVAVGPGGTVAVFYYDLRHSRLSSPQVATDAFVSLCRPIYPSDCATPANWREERVTEDSFDLLQAPYAYGLFLGDYQGLASDGVDFLAFFSRVHSGDRASVFFRRIAF